jgi:MYXO-CTERM domain-containing protein
VRVEVASQGRLVWPDGRRSEPLELTDGVAQTVSFQTRALSTGTFPVTVRVTDPTGEHELERTTVSVRSTAISGPALSATGLAVLALLLAGALRRRRPRRSHLEVVE